MRLGLARLAQETNWGSVAHNLFRAYVNVRSISKDSYSLDAPGIVYKTLKPRQSGVRVPILLDEHKEEPLAMASSRDESKRDDSASQEASASVLLSLKRRELNSLRRAKAMNQQVYNSNISTLSKISRRQGQ